MAALDLQESHLPGGRALAELFLALPVARRAHLVVLSPSARCATLFVHHSLGTERLELPAEAGAAMVARLALLTGLDPLAEAGSLAARANVTRVRIRVGADLAEVLLSIEASVLGLAAQLRLLELNGRAAEQRSSGVLKRCLECGVLQPAARTECDRDKSPLRQVVDEARPGGTIGPYEILGVLGAGGTGTVFAGQHALIGRPVAIKVLAPSLSLDPVSSRHFLAEARIAATLRHPSLVEVFDFGLLPTGQPFLVMERLAPRPLTCWLEDGPLAIHRALAVAREAAVALSVMHAAGVLHNDLKPSNIIMLAEGDEPRLKLIDFGAATMFDAVPGAMVHGTAAYMAPERIRGGMADARSDIYSLGITLFEMIAGHLPFDGRDDVSLLGAHQAHPIPPLTSPLGPVPVRVQRIVRRALSKVPAERHQSADELVGDIDATADPGAPTSWRTWLP